LIAALLLGIMAWWSRVNSRWRPFRLANDRSSSYYTQSLPRAFIPHRCPPALFLQCVQRWGMHGCCPQGKCSWTPPSRAQDRWARNLCVTQTHLAFPTGQIRSLVVQQPFSGCFLTPPPPPHGELCRTPPPKVPIFPPPEGTSSPRLFLSRNQIWGSQRGPTFIPPSVRQVTNTRRVRRRPRRARRAEGAGWRRGARRLHVQALQFTVNSGACQTLCSV
jgi:hypothetical protein